MAIGTADVKAILYEIAKVIEENKQYLTDLDAAIGDGDHGINMAKGFKSVVEKLETTDCPTPEALVKTTAMALISNVGGASGPLYGTLFLKAASVAKDKEELTLGDFCEMLQAGIEGVKARGKSEKGEKTMLDVLIPVQEALEAAQEQGKSGKEAFEEALKAAEMGVEYTKTIAATKGRASYVGDRSIGHIDPGAMSSCFMIKVIAEYLK